MLQWPSTAHARRPREEDGRSQASRAARPNLRVFCALLSRCRKIVCCPIKPGQGPEARILRAETRGQGTRAKRDGRDEGCRSNTEARSGHYISMQGWDWESDMMVAEENLLTLTNLGHVLDHPEAVAWGPDKRVYAGG